MKPRHEYEKDAAAIYRRSFAIIRSEADLARFSTLEERIAVRIIHACGIVDAARDLVFSAGAAEAAREALRAGAPIFCDARMVAEGVTRARLPERNEVICTLRDPSTPELALKLGSTRTAAAVELWLPRLGGSVVAIGNAPTALFRLLEAIACGAPRPAAIIGVPVGFVGAAESKQALIESGLAAIVMRGRMGGSAMAAAAVNALASDAE
jgi:precorrin-8X/cobalt-precorrin-8 methylmutase